MTDFFERLGEALNEATRREYGRIAEGPAAPFAVRMQTSGAAAARAERRARSSGRRWPVGVVLAALVVSASATATVLSLTRSTSRPLSGTVSGATGVPAGVVTYDIPITPDIEPGNAGWCSYPRFLSPGQSPPLHGASAGSCAPSSTGDQPFILGSARGSLFWMIVSSRVAAVRLSPSQTVRSRRDPKLPASWRAVVALVSATRPDQTLPVVRQRTGGLVPIDPTPLDSAGRPIPSHGVVAPRRSYPVRDYDPAAAPVSPCAIRQALMPGLMQQWEVVARELPQRGAPVGPRAVFSCARSWYVFDPRQPAISAAILVDASDPLKPAPRLPGLKRTGHPGDYREDGGSDGDLLARRVGPAWLVVQGGPDAIDTRLLHILTVHLRAR